MKASALVERWTAAAVLLATVALLATCGGGTTTIPSQQGPYSALPISGPPVVGESRIAFAILDQDNLFVDAEAVQVRFFRLSGDIGQLVGEAEAIERRIEDFLPHLHADGVIHPHREMSIFYTVDRFNFDTAGLWGLQVVASLPNSEAVPLQTPPFEVVAQPSWPTVGRPVPATHHKTLREVADITEIDSSSPPRPFMHQVAIDEALAQGKPFVLTFSTPAFCRTAVCGPVTDIVASFYTKYRDRLAFIHVEPYDLVKARGGQGLDVLPFIQNEWGLISEPWTFVVGADGLVVADFGGLFAPEELEAAIQKALAARAAVAP